MCLDPFTMLTIGGAALSGIGSIVQGEQAAALGEAQQDAYDQQAEADRRAAAFEAAKTARQQSFAAAAARAQIGASGVALQGSPTEVLVAQAGEDQLDLEAIKFGSTIRQNQLRTQGKIAAFSGKQQRTAGYIGGASNFISGISSLYDPNRAVKFGQSVFA